MNDHARLLAYVDRFVAKHGFWPRAGRAARALGWSVARVEDAVEGDPSCRLYSTSFHTFHGYPFADHFIEAFAP